LLRKRSVHVFSLSNWRRGVKKETLTNGLAGGLSAIELDAFKPVSRALKKEVVRSKRKGISR